MSPWAGLVALFGIVGASELQRRGVFAVKNAPKLVASNVPVVPTPPNQRAVRPCELVSRTPRTPGTVVTQDMLPRSCDYYGDAYNVSQCNDCRVASSAKLRDAKASSLPPVTELRTPETERKQLAYEQQKLLLRQLVGRA